MTAYWSSDCAPNVGPSPDHTDSEGPWNVGCQTYALKSEQFVQFFRGVLLSVKRLAIG